MIALPLPEFVAREIAIPGGEPEEDLHVTLAYVPGIAGDEKKRARLIQEISPIAATVAPLTGRIGGTGRFNASESSDGKDVFYASFNSPGLEALRAAVLAAIDKAGLQQSRVHGFTPHITLKYIDPGSPTPDFRPQVPDFGCDKLCVADRDRWDELQFSGTIILKGKKMDALTAALPTQVFKALQVEDNPIEILGQILEENDGYVGGTIRHGSMGGSDGSDYSGSSEKFSFGTMTFDVDRAKELMEGPNEEIEVDGAWSYKINVDKVAAMESRSKNPVIVASIPTERGIMPLLIDGHHRLYKAQEEDKETLPAFVLTPEQTLMVVECPPDLMTRLTQNLRDMDMNKAQPTGSQVHVPSTDNKVPPQAPAPMAKPPALQKPGADYAFPETNLGVGYRPRYKSAQVQALKTLGLVRKDLAIDVADALAEVTQMSEPEIEESTAAKWTSRAMAVFQLAQGEEDEDERCDLIDWGDDLYHEALEHAALVKDCGKTVAEVQALVEPYREKIAKGDAYMGREAMAAALGGLITLPEGKQVGNCQSCVYVSGDRCNHPAMNMELKSGAARMCCDHWYSNGVEYEGLSLGLVEDAAKDAGPLPEVHRGAEDNSVGSVMMTAEEMAKAALDEVDKGGPGSGPHPGAGKDKQENEKRQQMLARQAGKDKQRYGQYLARGGAMQFKNAVVKIAKADALKQIVYGVVLEPDTEDLQEDIMSAEDIEETAHGYMEHARAVKSRHRGQELQAFPVESYIAPLDFMLGEEHVRKGSWVLGVKVKDKAQWAMVESGEYTGFSVGGVGTREDM